MGMARARSRSPLRKAFAPPESFLETKKAQKTQKCSGCKEEGTSWVHMGPAKNSTILFWNRGNLNTYVDWEGAWYDFDNNALFVPFCRACVGHMHSTLTNKLKWTDEFEAISGLPVAMSLLAEQLVFKCQQLVVVPATAAPAPEADVEDGINMTDL